jgi:putative transcriptional regulator
MSNAAFAARLRQLRQQAGMTQAELAEAAGVHSQSIIKLESGEYEPKWQTVRALAKALGVSVLAFDVDDPPSRERPADEPPAAPRASKRK